MAQFDAVLGDKPNQIDRKRDDVRVTRDQLLDLSIPGGQITENGLRTNVSVGIRYVASWLNGVGAAAIDNLMEDAATAEISRSQVWQWIRTGRFAADHVKAVEREELDKIRKAVGDKAYADGRYDEAAKLFEQLALAEDFSDFLTTPAYQLID
jgi:malate synthase